MRYGISARDYLARAKGCLEIGSDDFLFYAAFEIRCGVEARMQEYLEVQEHITKRKRQGWQVAQLGRNVESAFKLGEKDAVLQIINKDTGALEFEFRYTPVKRNLRKRTEKLGNYLHAAKKYRPPEDVFWRNFREDLQEAVQELERATEGALLGPLLLHPNKNHLDMKLELLPNSDRDTLRKKLAAGSMYVMNIRYEENG